MASPPLTGPAEEHPDGPAALPPDDGTGGVRALLGRNRDFRRLLAAGLISQTGDWAVSTGLAYHVYTLTGSTLATAVMLLLSRLPDVVLGPVAGVLADRWDRRRLLVGADLLLAAGLLPLLLVREPGQVWIVYAVALWTGVLSTVLYPAQRALVPQLVAEAQLVRANALHGQSAQAARLVGALAGGVAVGAGGLAAVVWIDVASFVLSALLLAGLRTRGHAPAVAPRFGLRLERAARPLLVYMMITGLGEGVFGTLVAPFVADVLDGRGDAYGLFLSVQAVGGIAGGLAVAAWLGNAAPRALLGWGAVTFGLADLALFTYPLVSSALWPAFVLIAVAGVPAAAAGAGFVTMTQTVTAAERRGAVFGLLGSAHAATALLGTALAGLLGDVLGIVATLCVHAAGLVTAGLLALRLLRAR